MPEIDMSQNSTKLCAICGVNPATTDDHVPPRSIFPQPRPQDTITVPACSQCNNGSSVLDEEFKALLSLHVTRDGETLENQKVVAGALRTLDKNNRLRSQVLDDAKLVYVSTRSGIAYGMGYAVPWEKEKHDAVIERVIRGLYYDRYGDILGGAAKVGVEVLAGLTDKAKSIIDAMKRGSIGGDQFAFHYERTASHPLRSLWFLNFFEKHWVLAETAPTRDEFITLSA